MAASGGLVSQYSSRLRTVHNKATAHLFHLVPQKNAGGLDPVTAVPFIDGDWSIECQ